MDIKSVKDIRVIPIAAKDANIFVKKWHYSKRVCFSQIHFGCMYDDQLIGCLQYGSSIDKRRTAVGLRVGMNEYLELNRMAMIDDTPKNTESRVIAITLKILKKKYPFLKLILSYADACQCGDGTIYRASGFDLIGIKKNKTLYKLSDKAKIEVRKYIKNANTIISDKSLNEVIAKKPMGNHILHGKYLTSIVKELGSVPLEGYQFKYVYFYDKTLREKFTIIPSSKIPLQCKMYKATRHVEHENNAPKFHLGESGVIPTNVHQTNISDISC